MQVSLSMMGSAAAARRVRTVVAPRRSELRLEPIHPTHPLRTQCERFIATRFHRAYGAEVTHFSPQLLGVRDALERWHAAAGYAPADGRRLFLEQYLDAPIEKILARGRTVARESIVEVGQLAATSVGMGRTLVPLLARHLHRLGYEWVVFTATRELRNAVARLGLTPLELAPADPARLPDGARQWGTYYASDPIVVAGRIAHGLRGA
jgi:phosphoglycolate phosphatase-like HAD superfamily hydrolase